jgi:hypothetical protein
VRWGLIPGWWKKTAKEVPSTGRDDCRDDDPSLTEHIVDDAFAGD